MLLVGVALRVLTSGTAIMWVISMYDVCFQGIGDMNLAYQCNRLALTSNNDHPEAYNNLGVLEMRKGHVEQVRQSL